MTKYIAMESVKVAPETFAVQGQEVEVLESNPHIELLVSKGLLKPVDGPAEAAPATAKEVEIPAGPEPAKPAPKGK